MPPLPGDPCVIRFGDLCSLCDRLRCEPHPYRCGVRSSLRWLIGRIPIRSIIRRPASTTLGRLLLLEREPSLSALHLDWYTALLHQLDQQVDGPGTDVDVRHPALFFAIGNLEGRHAALVFRVQPGTAIHQQLNDAVRGAP